MSCIVVWRGVEFSFITLFVCHSYQFTVLETFMGVVQRTAAGSNPRISRIVSKSDSDHGSGYYGHYLP